jgi:hypothetical protein
MLNLLTIRLKLDKLSKRRRSTIFKLLEINHTSGKSFPHNLPTSSKTSAIKIKKNKRVNRLMNYLLNKKLTLKPRKKVLPFLLNQYQQLRFKKKNKLKGVDLIKISPKLINKYNLNEMRLVKQQKQIPPNLLGQEEGATEFETNPARTYRQPFRMAYKKHLNLLVRYQYKL